MPLKFAPLCSYCHERRTLDDSGICSVCRKKGVRPSRICVLCGKRKTFAKSGICWKCQKKQISKDPLLIDTIAQARTKLKILRSYKRGISIDSLAEKYGVSKDEISKLIAQNANP